MQMVGKGEMRSLVYVARSACVSRHFKDEGLYTAPDENSFFFLFSFSEVALQALYRGCLRLSRIEAPLRKERERGREGEKKKERKIGSK